VLSQQEETSGVGTIDEKREYVRLKVSQLANTRREIKRLIKI